MKNVLQNTEQEIELWQKHAQTEQDFVLSHILL